MNRSCDILEDQAGLTEALLGQAIVRADRALASRIAGKCAVEIHLSGAEIISQGARDTDLYFILKGSVSVVAHGRVIARRVAGQHVGEISLANPEGGRSASVIALEETVTARISEPDFTQLAEEMPQLWRWLAIGLGDGIKAHNESEARLEFVANHDALTLLPNRRYFLERLAETLRLVRDTNSTCALLYIDLDRFKPINDTFGHPAGDQIMKQVAGRMRHCLDGKGMVSRLGGDEFAALLACAGGHEQAERVAADLLAALREPFDIQGVQVAVYASIGVAFYPSQAQDVATLMQRADAALYEAKKNGRNTFRVWA
ncbi:GGDEF domain-containing protein [Noviherbaspirillum massiliense]|uniref:GGDEF domain-containing protein n=1 Tax=Noviherbaspirillum massiliense TaxID=1465823 RepID=UPI00030A1EA6|nr:GGDEF domain-containing protein [Noviherbaspirillum massiliense]